MRSDPITAIGEVAQLAFVPADIDAALRYWTKTIGAGPFVAFDHIPTETCSYQGAASDIDFTLYIGYWGALQIELIVQHNDAPSIYRAWRDERREGLHHVCVFTEDMARARAILAAAGTTIVQEVTLADGIAGVYAETGGGQGSLLEILKPNRAILDSFAHIRSLSVGWDGSEPVRRLG